MTNQKTIIIIPTYNEANNITALLQQIFALNVHHLSVVIIDDNSLDGTQDIVKALQKKYPINLIERPKKLGIGSAYIAGFDFALSQGADLIFEMDADGSHDPKMIPHFIHSLLSSGGGISFLERGLSEAGSVRPLLFLGRGRTDPVSRQCRESRVPQPKNEIPPPSLIIGSRRIPGGNVAGWDKRRNAQSALASWCARTLLRLNTNDVTSGFRCYRADVLKTIPLKKITSNGYSFQVEILWWCERLGFTVKEIPIHFIDRKHGKSKLSISERIKFFITLLRLWHTKLSTKATSSLDKLDKTYDLKNF